jgi:hypothetical protein
VTLPVDVTLPVEVTLPNEVTSPNDRDQLASISIRRLWRLLDDQSRTLPGAVE